MFKSVFYLALKSGIDTSVCFVAARPCLVCSLNLAKSTSSPNYDHLIIMCYYIFRWIYHHYLAMLMALVSLTWEIKGQPDCSSKQVFDLFVEVGVLLCH